MKKLYLHIGTPKTGTSTLQHFFSNNREVLENKGIYYPLWPEYDSLLDGGKESTFGNFGWIERVAMDDEHKKEIIEDIFEKYDNVLLSTECIWIETKDKSAFLRWLKDICDIDIRVIVYLRRQDDYLEAQYREYVRVLQFTDSIHEVFDCNSASLGEVKETLNYLSILNDMADVIGKNNIIIRPYEKGQFRNNSIIDDFLYLLGLTPDKAYKMPEKNYNPSMSNDALELKRRMNKSGIATIKELNDCFYETLMIDGIESAISNSPVHFKSMLSAEERSDFMKQFEKSNEQIAREYLGREDGKLFYQNYNACDNAANDVFVEHILDETIKIFTSTFLKMNNRIIQLEDKINELQISRDVEDG
ncbi:MAG: hypothetical protein HFH14_04525 [Lachnospiraceae bacterium]|nr:hypothetical protein [Lachnospiraceae bacterium]